MLNTAETPGQAPAVVLLHGVFMDHTLWDDVAAALPGRHLVAVDMPGHGSSPVPERNATIDDHVRQVAETLDAANLDGAVIVGHSWGGMVGLRLAAQRPDLVGGLVMTNTPLRKPRGATRLGFLLQRAILAAGFPLGAYAGAAARSLYGRGHLARHPDTAAALAARLRHLGRTGIRRTIRSVILEPPDAIGDVAHLAVPYRILGGEHDYVLGPAVLETLRSLGAEPIVTPGGHTGPTEAPVPVAESIGHVIGAM